jgi:hypothetical protein
MSATRTAMSIFAAAHPSLNAAVATCGDALRRLRVERALGVVVRARLSPEQGARLLVRAFALQDDLIRTAVVGEQREHVHPLLCHAALSLAGERRRQMIVYALAGSGQLLSWSAYDFGVLDGIEAPMRAALRDAVCTTAARVVIVLAADGGTEPDATSAGLSDRLAAGFAAVGLSVRGVYSVGPQQARDLASGRVEWIAE